MDYIVFDLEWNQPVDFADTVTFPSYLSGEIVEIGAVKLNEKFETVSELKVYIRPQYYQKMHRKIAALTGIHDRELREKGMPFPEAYRTFMNWCGEQYTFLTWSNSDISVLVENMKIHGISTDYLPDLVDVQRIFGREIMRSDVQYSLEYALEILGEKGEKAHDALHDAKNTVRICDHLDLELYIQEYTSRMFIDSNIYSGYETWREILNDSALMTFLCPWCGSKAVCETWIPGKHNKMIALATCEDGDEFLVTLSRHKTPDGHYEVFRTFYEMSDDYWDQYCSRLERAAVAS